MEGVSRPQTESLVWVFYLIIILKNKLINQTLFIIPLIKYSHLFSSPMDARSHVLNKIRFMGKFYFSEISAAFLKKKVFKNYIQLK